jgi:hypothetical protein
VKNLISERVISGKFLKRKNTTSTEATKTRIVTTIFSDFFLTDIAKILKQ